MRFKADARSEQDLANAQTIARVTGTLEGFQQSHGKYAAVSVAYVLDLLNPRGMWSLDRGRRAEPENAEQPQGRSPTADPITGCEPVTAPGAGDGG